MSNIGLVTSREYFSRVKKKSFIVMTLIAPLLITLFYGAIVWVSINDQVGAKEKVIAIADHSELFQMEFKQQGNLQFRHSRSFNRDSLLLGLADGFIEVPEGYGINNDLEITYESHASLSAKENGIIQEIFEEKIRKHRLKDLGIEEATIDSLQTSVLVKELKIDEEGNAKNSSIVINTIVGMGLSVLIYFFIFLYGVQVMRGVIEEKTNRIVELMISTLKPFELMMGKVIGIAFVGLTQLGIWVLLTSILSVMVSVLFGVSMMDYSAQLPSHAPTIPAGLSNTISALFDLPLLSIFFLFLFFFLGGYLLYGALFAAIGSAVDSETDTQQFMMPVTLPLVFSFIVSFSVVINDPNGSLATWLSIVPITSPIVMMARLPFAPPTWQILVSMLVLVCTIVATIYLAGRIYRTGILLYGKKPTYRELFKWLFYKN